MPTLQEITAAHSTRLSTLHQRRDAALGAAAIARDSELRALADTAKLYAAFDQALAEGFDDRLATEQKAAAARDTAFARAASTRTSRLADEQARRRQADLDAFDRKVRAETVAEQAYRDALSGLTSTTALDARQKSTLEAERRRHRARLEAQEAYARALADAHTAYRTATEKALSDERAAERAATLADAAARRLAAASEAAAAGAAERTLSKGLLAIPAARAALDRYRAEVQRIRTQALRDEQALFAELREQLQHVER